jgi:hypothetical protein
MRQPTAFRTAMEPRVNTDRLALDAKRRND